MRWFTCEWFEVRSSLLREHSAELRAAATVHRTSYWKHSGNCHKLRISSSDFAFMCSRMSLYAPFIQSCLPWTARFLQSSKFLWKILRFFSYLAGESAANLYYVITPLFYCQYGFCWFFVVTRITCIRNLQQRLRIYHINFSK